MKISQLLWSQACRWTWEAGWICLSLLASIRVAWANRKREGIHRKEIQRLIKRTLSLLCSKGIHPRARLVAPSLPLLIPGRREENVPSALWRVQEVATLRAPRAKVIPISPVLSFRRPRMYSQMKNITRVMMKTKTGMMMKISMKTRMIWWTKMGKMLRKTSMQGCWWARKRPKMPCSRGFFKRRSKKWHASARSNTILLSHLYLCWWLATSLWATSWWLMSSRTVSRALSSLI